MRIGGNGMKIVLVEWEDIMGLTHKPLPVSDSEIRPLIKHTVGYLIEFAKHLVVVTDYDETHAGGGGYGHNDFTVIPKGVVLEVTELARIEPKVSDPRLEKD